MNGLTTVAVVVPCFNESDRLDRWKFLKFAQLNEWVRFFFVNDGSTDATPQLLTQMASENPQQVVAIHLPTNCGKAEAVRQGLGAAIEEGHRIVGFFDADLATPLEELATMRAILLRRNDIDAVLGSRLGLAGRRIRRQRLRAFLGRLFARGTKTLLGLPLHDTQCGAKLFRATETLREVIREPFRTRWIFDVELLCRCAAIEGRSWLRSHLYELPVDQWRDVAGSKVRGRDFVTAGRELLQITWSHRRRIDRRGQSVKPRLPQTEDSRRAA